MTPEELRTEFGRPEYEVLWRQARTAVARGQRKLGYKAPTPQAAARVSSLLGALEDPPTREPLTSGVGTTIVVADLDARLRNAVHYGLSDVLEAVHGTTAEFSPVQASVEAQRREWSDTILWAALTKAGLADRPWAGLWVDQVRRYAKIPPERLEVPAGQAVAILAGLHLTSETAPTTWSIRADLAAAHGAPHGLDRGHKLAALVLRGAALAHRVDHPRTARDERRLWERCGVALDGVATTVLTWALPVIGDSPWATMLRSRTDLGLPTHLTLRDLAAAPNPLVATGTRVWTCETPRVLEAAVNAGATAPMVCVSGHLNPPTRHLLTTLATNGADIAYHGEFTPDGLRLTSQVLALTNGTPWRMSTEDYREALRTAQDSAVDLPALEAEPPQTPWSPNLPEAMRAGWSIPEEQSLPLLLPDLL